jgi:pimeloyl-ACP methyl ester carboxylesterase
MTLPYDDVGSGPVVMLLHAGVADRSMWSGLLPLDGVRAVAPDLPGFGEAPVRPGPQAPWEDVLSLLASLDVSRAALVGVSFGGAVALRVASIAPALVSKLVLVSAPPPDLSPSPELAAAWEAEEEALERGDVTAAARAVAEAWVRPGPVRSRVEAMQRRAFELQLAAGDVDEAPDPLDVSRLDMPLVVAAGEHDMPDFRDPAFAAALGVELELIPGAGHLAPLEVPDVFRERLRAWL